MLKSQALALKAILASALLIAMFIWVQIHLDWSTILNNWQKVRLSDTLIVAAMVFASHFLRVFRVHIAFRRAHNVHLRDVAGVSLTHNTISFLLPMRLGEAALPLLSKQQLAVPLSYSSLSLVLLRVFDAHVLLMLLLFFASGAYFGDNAKFLSLMILLSTPLIVIVLIIIARKHPKFEGIRALVNSSSMIIVLYLLTVVIWSCKLAALAYMASKLGGISIEHSWIATIIADASALSPITGFANAGTFEAAFTLPLLPLGYEGPELVQTALNLHILILITNLIAGAVGLSLIMFKKSVK